MNKVVKGTLLGLGLLTGIYGGSKLLEEDNPQSSKPSKNPQTTQAAQPPATPGGKNANFAEAIHKAYMAAADTSPASPPVVQHSFRLKNLIEAPDESAQPTAKKSHRSFQLKNTIETPEELTPEELREAEAEPLKAKGNEALANGDYDLAISQYAAANKIAPHWSKPVGNAALAYSSKYYADGNAADLQSSIVLHEKTISLAPTKGISYQNYGSLYQNLMPLCDTDSAANKVATDLGIDTAGKDSVMNALATRAQAVYEAGIVADPTYGRNYQLQADLFKERGKIKEAYMIVNQGLENDPDNLDLAHTKGNILLQGWADEGFMLDMTNEQMRAKGEAEYPPGTPGIADKFYAVQKDNILNSFKMGEEGDFRNVFALKGRATYFFTIGDSTNMENWQQVEHYFGQAKALFDTTGGEDPQDEAIREEIGTGLLASEAVLASHASADQEAGLMDKFNSTLGDVTGHAKDPNKFKKALTEQLESLGAIIKGGANKFIDVLKR